MSRDLHLESAGLQPQQRLNADVSLGVDPGVNLGIAIARRRQPGEPSKFGYVLLHYSTIRTPPEHNAAERVAEYRDGLRAICHATKIHSAHVEVPWRRVRTGNALSVYTRGGKNVGNLVLLAAITGAVFSVLHECRIPVYEIPAPMGFRSKAWEKQKEYEAKGVFGADLRKHEAVAAMLALKGL